ncbi:diguanylate cyclase domain-containing protein [Thiohalorhabdus sp.]
MGDQVLIQFVRTIGSLLGQSDTLARTGGEEFVILAPQTERERT